MNRVKSEGVVLVVDDVLENRALAEAYLKKLGWQVLEANSGLSAIELLKSFTPSHILLDIKMPGIDGVGVARFVQEKMANCNIRVIGYTAHALNDEIEHFLESGFDSVMIKPITYIDISNQFGPANAEFC